MMKEIGDIVVEDIRHRISTLKQSPEGEAWSPWADSTAKARQRKGNAALGLLVDSGTLLRSITSQVIGSHHTVQIGTNVPYAGYLNDGTPKMPARPFLGVSERAQHDINEVMKQYLGEHLK
jgi:phage gpG-like protein